ncbi:MAG: type II toxin-antitoxin system RelE/ParE family toxin [Ignavibacteriaceae bacterium]
MRVEFLSGFEKDLANTRDKLLAKLILECINKFEKADKISEVPNIKKLKGHSAAFRFRKGKYRIGFYLEGEIIVFAAFDTRDKIYQRFP